jgi:hypothetical protein
MERFAPRGFSRIRISRVMHKASLQECGAPQHEYRPHPATIVREVESARNKRRAGNQNDIESHELRQRADEGG